METLTIMPTTILEHIKACDLPDFLTKKLKVKPDTLIKLTIEVEDEDTGDGLWPPEEDFTPEFIEAVKQSEEDVKAGNYITYEDGSVVRYVNGKKEIYIKDVPDDVSTVLDKMMNE